MFGSKNTPKVQQTVSRAVNYEITIADIAKRSERRAWFVAFGAILMSLILAAGYFYMLPLKEKVPYLVMADAYTGTSSVARLKEDFSNQSITSSEAINRSNVAHFILARESYDVAMIQLRDWSTVFTMSSPEVAAEYSALHANTNASSPYNTYGRARAIRVKILSIVLLGGGNGAAPKGATVRFQRSLFDKANGASQALDSKIATLEFTYKPNLKMDEEKRIQNPLGFQVTSYRVDNDYAASPPIEAPAPAAMPDAMPAPPMQDPAMMRGPGIPDAPPQAPGAAAGPGAPATPSAAGNPGTPNGDSNR